jgi:hypothetical protein
MCWVVPEYLMALDRPDDESDDGRPEQPFRPGGSGGDVPAAQAETVEPRTHEEYYEALRAADSGPADDIIPAGTR